MRIAYRSFLLAFFVNVANAAEPGITAHQIAQIDRSVDAGYSSIFLLYKHFHRNPELSFHEEATAKQFAHELTEIGYDVTTGVGGNGVVAVLRNGPGPTVMLRCDLDALPVLENTGLEYASVVKTKDDEGQEVNVMHACGHDVHMACAIGTARVMRQLVKEWSGTFICIAEPAEERGVGSQRMLADGLFTRFPKPDFIMAIHVDPRSQAGKVTCREGHVTSNADQVDIIVRGRGGHGAAPHMTVDPVVTACRIVVDLQTIVAREMNPLDSAVITVGSIHGGTKHNVIPNEVALKLTVRSYKDETRKKLREAITRITTSVAESARAPKPEVKITEGAPSTYNDPALAAKCLQVFERVLGKENADRGEPDMVSEDFSRYGREGIPAVLYRVGAISAERWARSTTQPDSEPPPSLHSSEFAPDPEPTIKTGIRTLTAASLNLLVKTN